MPDTLLIVVEDPGAANYVRSIPDAVADTGIACQLMALGPAVGYLEQREVPFKTWQDSSPSELLARYEPGLVLVGSSDNKTSPVHELVDLCKKNKVTTVAAVDMRMNANKRFCGQSDDPLRHAPDYLLVPDIETKAAFVELGFDSERVVAAGHPHYDFVRARAKEIRAKQMPDAPAQKTITFVAEPASKLDPALTTKSNKYTLTGTTGSTARTDIVLEELIAAISSTGIEADLVVRLHPKNQASEFAAYKDSIKTISSGGDPLELICQSDLVVGMTSMLMIEAYLAGAQTLSIVPTEQERLWLPTVTAGLTPVASDRAAIEHYLRNWAGGRPDTASSAATKKDSFAPGALARVVKFLVNLMERP